uniref:Desmoglein 2 n=1 Tax=Neogobius melanostomus TaxID=47308 RepID=A0A8C6UWC5_9GOBI
MLLTSEAAKVRKKREWVIPPAKLMENTDYRDREYIAKIRSDRETTKKVQYFLSGPGADKHPFSVFVVDHDTGFVKVNVPSLDRELYPHYNLTGVARFLDGSKAEDDIPLVVTVLDQNDNAPVFETQTGSINEMSVKGTVVMTLRGTDADQEGTINSRLHYTIISQEPKTDPPMFVLDAKTGEVKVRETDELDRETFDFYKLMIEVKDMGGGVGALSGSGSVEITVLDINDNPPVLEKTAYAGAVDENVDDVVVMRIKATDRDLRPTDNWLARFHIVKGNEDGLFSITTDPETNEGILRLVKVRAAQNSICHGTPISIKVNNIPEGPEFQPETKEVPVSEDPDQSLDAVIVTYPAIDPDTGKTAENVNYAKAHDPDNWITIDDETAEIRLNKAPDRESPHVVNGTYYAKIVAITKDMPSKTATGTIAIKVKDFNDHCPTLESALEGICLGQKSVNVSASDEDLDPNGAPFTFKIIPENTRGLWNVEVISATKATLVSQEILWRGQYLIEVAVFDAQGLSCPTPEVLTVEVCECGKDKNALSCNVREASSDKPKESNFGGPAVAVMLCAACLLFLIPFLLVFCQCGGPNAVFADKFSELPFEAKEHLISYHTEGQGEDKHIQTVISYDETNMTRGKGGGQGFRDGDHTKTDREPNFKCGRFFVNNQWTTYDHPSGLFENMALPEEFLVEYYTQVRTFLNSGDALLVYNDEGCGSPAGSVGCCSLLESDNDLQFLDDLGPKFKILADICVPPKPVQPPTPTHKVKQRSQREVFPGYIVVGGPQIAGQAGGVTRSTSTIISSTGVSGGFTSGSLPSSPLPTVFVSGSPSSPITSPTSPTILLPGSPGSPGVAGMEGWKMVGPNPEGHYTLVPDKKSTALITETKSTAVEADSSNSGSPQGTSPEGDVLKKKAAPPQGVLGHAAHSGVTGILSGHPLTSTRGLVTVNKPWGGGWVVQSQPTELSPVFSPGLPPVAILGAGVGVTQNKGVHIIQNHTPLVQHTIVNAKDSKPSSKQDTGKPSFSRTLAKKGKNVPKKIHIEKAKQKDQWLTLLSMCHSYSYSHPHLYKKLL